MKLRLIETGFDSLTGQFGGVDFVDGVSVNDLTPVEAGRLANLVRAENIDGVNPSMSQAVIDSKTISMTVEKPLVRGKDDATSAPAADASPTMIYTKEGLEQLADKEGIAGLRSIAEPLNIRSKSIAALIQAIMDHQNGIKTLSDEERVEAATPYADQK